MNRMYVLYNPLAGNKDGEKKAKKLEGIYPTKNLTILILQRSVIIKILCQA